MGMFRVLWSRVGSALSRAAASLFERHLGHVRYGHAGRSCSPSTRASVVSRGICAVAALVLSFMVVLSGVLVFSPVERASADTVELGPDGYFSTLNVGALPVVSNGWANTRKIVFGKQGNVGTYDSKQVSGGYKTLAKGAVASVPDADYGLNETWSKSATTSVAAGEALLFFENVVTGDFKFDDAGNGNSFDSATGSYKSNLAKVSDAVGAANYSSFEKSLLRAAQVEGVCTAARGTGCGSYSYTEQKSSVYSYTVFPLSIGDVRKYFNHTSGGSADTNLASNGGTHTRSAMWRSKLFRFLVNASGTPTNNSVGVLGPRLRPALRLKLGNLLLSAHSENQSQVLNAPGSSVPDSLRLTFVESGKKLNAWSAAVVGGAGSRALSLSGSSEYGAVLGWKVVDPAQPLKVLGSGRTSAGGNMLLPESLMTDESKDYDLYVWGQQDGTATEGLTNRATEPVKTTIKGWKVKLPPSYGIDVSGVTDGGLKAYRIGDYGDVVFDHTGALESVKVSTPVSVRSAVASAAGSAGGSNVDGVNPMGWVVARWLGYPSDPLSDDTTSAFDPYAGQLQSFAQALAGKSDSALGGVQGSLPATTFSNGGTVRLSVAGPGLYLIVDSSGESLPIIVGTKAFNDALGVEGVEGVEGVMVDFAGAGVDGRHRLGVAELKTSRMDLSKRVVND
ncbi:MAG: hypothetical protein ABF805_03560, partial [Bifidobacterium sp.]|uniref:hypothetical protein n=1 Tax=Bifidobacterium sp. TaxID=41200 RepID=UPI0039ECAD78